MALILLFLALFFGFVQGGPTMDLLYRDLMKGYEKDLRPTASHEIATNVTFGFLLHSIVDVNEKHQIMRTRAWLNLNWMDHRLTWNASDYGGLKLMQMPHDKVWRPDVVLMNNGVQAFGTLLLSTDVYLTHEGNITWLVSTVLNSNCKIFMKKFPFDAQKCFMNFTSWSYDGSEINLKLITEEGDTSAYTENTEFTLMYLKAKRHQYGRGLGTNISWPIISIIIKIQRRSFFYLYNHMFPGFIISAMSLVGFLIPSESGEKVTMYTTTMLSMGVYLRAITKIVPSSDEASVVGIYFMLCLCSVCVITMFNILNLNNYSNRTRFNLHPVPEWVKKWILGYVAKLLRVDLSPEFIETKKKFSVFHTPLSTKTRIDNVSKSNVICVSSQSGITDENTCPGVLLKQRKIDANLQPVVREIEFAFQSVLDNIWESLLRNEARIQKNDEKSLIIWEWKAMSLIVDRFLMALFFVASLTTGMLFLFRPHSVF